MANSQTRWSTSIVAATPEQVEWLLRHIRANEELQEELLCQDFFDHEDLGFDCLDDIDLGFVTGHSDKDPLVIHCYSEECNNVDALVLIVARWQEAFGIKESWSVECAYTCDKPREGEFGGCAFFVKQGRIHCSSTSAWLDSMQQEHNE